MRDETAWCARSTGFEWIAPFLESHGFGAAIPSPEAERDRPRRGSHGAHQPTAHRHGDKFFGYERPTDFRLEERHPQLYPPTCARRRWPRTRRSSSWPPRASSRRPSFCAHLAGALALPRQRPGQRALVSGAAHKDPRRPKQAIVVLPQWNSDGFSHNALCTLFNRMGVSALRLSMPYHDIRRPAELERSDYSVSANIGRTLAACRQRWSISAAAGLAGEPGL